MEIILAIFLFIIAFVVLGAMPRSTYIELSGRGNGPPTYRSKTLRTTCILDGSSLKKLGSYGYECQNDGIKHRFTLDDRLLWDIEY